MKDLDNSTFFDNRLLNFITDLVYGRKPPSTINNVENVLLKKKDELIAIDNILDGNLVSLLRNSKDFVSPKDGVQFLLICHKKDILDDGVAVLEFAERDERALSLEQLRELIENSGDLPMAWAVSLHGDDEDSRYAEPKTSKPELDLDRLKNFK